MPAEWTPRQRHLRKVALATLSALALDLTLVNMRGEVSGLHWLFLVGAGIYLVGITAIIALLLLALEWLRMRRAAPL